MTSDLLLINGDICTMNPGLSRTEGVLIRGGRIVALGDAARSAGAADMISVGGRLVLRGVQDAHIHLLNPQTVW